MKQKEQPVEKVWATYLRTRNVKKRNEKPAKLLEQAAKKIMDRQATVARRGRRR